MNRGRLINEGLAWMADADAGAALLVKVSLLLLLAWAAHFALKGANPRWRVLLWRGVPVGALLIAAAEVLPGDLNYRITVPEVAPVTVSTTEPPSLPPLEHANITSVIETSPPASEGREGVAGSAGTLTTGGRWFQGISPVFAALIAWGLGIAAGLIGLFFGHGKVARWVKRSVPAGDESLTAETARIGKALGLVRIPRILCCGDIPAPLVAGWRRPVLLLPAALLAPDYAGDRAAILAHEMAHIRNRDIAWSYVLHLFTLVLWFHPLAWWMRRVHAGAAERVADAMSAAYVGGAEPYSRTLARVVLLMTSNPPRVAGLPMARPAEITRRLADLRRRLFARPIPRWASVSVLLVALTGVGLFGAMRVVQSEPTVNIGVKPSIAIDMEEAETKKAQAGAKAINQVDATEQVETVPFPSYSDPYRKFDESPKAYLNSLNPSPARVVESSTKIWVYYKPPSDLPPCPYDEFVDATTALVRFHGTELNCVGLGRLPAGTSTRDATHVVDPIVSSEGDTVSDELLETRGLDRVIRCQLSPTHEQWAAMYIHSSNSEYSDQGTEVITRDGSGNRVSVNSSSGGGITTCAYPCVERRVKTYGGILYPIPNQVELVLYLRKKTPDTFVIPDKEGVSVEIPGNQITLVDRFEGNYGSTLFDPERNGYRIDYGRGGSGTNINGEEYIDAGIHSTEGVKHVYTGVFFTFLRRVNEDQQRFVAITRDGREIEPRNVYYHKGCMAVIRFECKSEEIKEFRILKNLTVKVLLHLPGIPGLPSENATCTNILDLRIPRARFSSSSEAAMYLRGLLHNYFDSAGAKPAEVGPLEFTDASVREILNTYYPGRWPIRRPGGRAAPVKSATETKPQFQKTGQILSPDDTPAVGAEVYFSTPKRSLVVDVGERTTLQPVKTDAEGRLTDPLPEPPFDVIVMHDSGFAHVSHESYNRNDGVRLKPWGRVEGEYVLGGKEIANASIVLMYGERTIGAGAIHVELNLRSETDENGRFVFEKAPPCVARFSPTQKMPNGGERYTRDVNAEVRSGETVNVTIGKSGQPVTGKAVVSSSAELVDWSSAHLTMSMSIWDAADRTHSADAWFEDEADKGDNSAEGSKNPKRDWSYMAGTYGFSQGLNPDGTFRIEDVPSGEYTLWLDAIPRYDSEMKQSEYVGDGHVGFVIPLLAGGYSTEPKDLGSVEVEVRKRNADGTFPMSGAIIKETLANRHQAFKRIKVDFTYESNMIKQYQEITPIGNLQASWIYSEGKSYFKKEGESGQQHKRSTESSFDGEVARYLDHIGRISMTTGSPSPEDSNLLPYPFFYADYPVESYGQIETYKVLSVSSTKEFGDVYTVKDQTTGWHNVLKLSSKYDYSPIEVKVYANDILMKAWEFHDLTKSAEGVWYPRQIILWRYSSEYRLKDIDKSKAGNKDIYTITGFTTKPETTDETFRLKIPEGYSSIRF